MYVPRTFHERFIPTKGLKMLFIHTPKCGGSTVGSAFGNRFRKCVSVRTKELKGHLTWMEYRERLPILGREISEFITFSTIRNPFEWHISWFNYIKRQKPNKTGYVIEHVLFQKFNFSDYISWLEDETAQRTHRHDMGRQVSDWVCDENGKIVVNEILRQETLISDLEALRDRYGLVLRMPKEPLNKFGTGKKYQDFYSDKDVEIIAKRHKRDLALFNYSF